MIARGKRGDVSISTIITFIVLLVGFAILLFFLSQLKWTGTVDKQVCHESVIFRGTLPSIAGAKTYVPLKCATEKICVTAKMFGKGDCPEFADAKSYSTLRVSDVHGVEKAVAQNIISCWDMMGQGKVSIFSEWFAERYGIGKVYPSCVICNRIAYDVKSLESKKIDLKTMDVMAYMQTRQMPDKTITYMDYLVGEKGKVSFDRTGGSVFLPLDIKTSTSDGVSTSELVPATGDDAKGVGIDTSQTKQLIAGQDAAFPDLYKKETAIVFMQITSPKHGESITHIATDSLGVTAGAFALAPGLMTTTFASLGKVIGKACINPAGAIICTALVAVAGVYQQGSVYYNRGVTAGYCGDVSTGSEARDGCSVVRTTNYDVEDIQNYCSVIESIP